MINVRSVDPALCINEITMTDFCRQMSRGSEVGVGLTAGKDTMQETNASITQPPRKCALCRFLKSLCASHRFKNLQVRTYCRRRARKTEKKKKKKKHVELDMWRVIVSPLFSLGKIRFRILLDPPKIVDTQVFQDVSENREITASTAKLSILRIGCNLVRNSFFPSFSRSVDTFVPDSRRSSNRVQERFGNFFFFWKFISSTVVCLGDSSSLLGDEPSKLARFSSGRFTELRASGFWRKREESCFFVSQVFNNLSKQSISVILNNNPSF